MSAISKKKSILQPEIPQNKKQAYFCDLGTDLQNSVGIMSEMLKSSYDN